MSATAGNVRSVGILVAGMHRSGTSATTRMLASLGCDLPATLMEADSHNAMGYWESTEIADLNDAILDSAGSSWDDWEVFDPEWYVSATAEDFLERAQALLLSEFGDSRLFVLKDPRICRLLEFWKEAFDRIGAAPLVALPVRNPLEVAASLRERDAIDPSIGMLLWLRNVLDAEVGSRGLPRAFCRYEDVLDDWKSLAARLGSELDVAWPQDSTAADPEVEPLISSSIRHHALDEAHVYSDPLVARWVKTVFEIFNRWARGRVQGNDAATLDAIRAAFNDSGPNFNRAIAVGRQATEQNREYETQVAALGRAAQSLEQAVVSGDRQIAKLDRSVRERDRLVADRDNQLHSLSRSLSERDQQVAERDGRITAVSQLLSERDGQVAERDTQIAERDTRIAERDTQIAERDTRIAERDTRIAERDARIESLDGTVAARDSQIQAIYGSTSWRITRPLRILKTVLSRLLRGTSRLLAGATYQIGSFLWRLTPLGPFRSKAKGSLLRLLPQSFVDRTTHGYIASGRMQLADRTLDAVDNRDDTPILFDPEYYLAANADVRNSGADPLRHYMDHGAMEGRLPFPLDPDEIDPVVEALHRIDLRRDEVFAFDAGFYRDLHPDLAQLDDTSLLDHYRDYGRKESRAGSRGEFVRQVCDDPREIPLDFKASEYIDLYPDLLGFSERSPVSALRHYMSRGRWEPRLHTWLGDEAFVSPDPSSVEMPPELTFETPPLCVLVHIYYPDLWEELARYLANLPEGTYDLYVNLVDTTCTPELEQQIRNTFPNSTICVSENIGRDIGGHFRLLRSIPMEKYRFFGLIHSKKSPHLAPGDALLWRRRLLTALMGTRELAVDNLKLMLTDETIGLIGARRCRDTTLKNNAEKFLELLDLLDVKPGSRDVEFLSGTIMYVRRQVLQRIFETCKDLPFEKGDDTPLQFHLDAQWAHAIERVIGNVVRDMTYRFEWR